MLVTLYIKALSKSGLQAWQMHEASASIMRKITIAGNGLIKRKRHSNGYLAMALDMVLSRRGRPPTL
jgi:hypothetical protein